MVVMVISPNLSQSLSNSCTNSDLGRFFVTGWFIGYLLVFPIFPLVLYVGYTKWQSRRRISHSDVFTLNMAVVEMVSTVGYTLFIYGLYADNEDLMEIANAVYISAVHAEISLHCLTCTDRYLAVVQPIMYLRLKERGRARNISIGLAWLFSVVSSICSYFFPSFELIQCAIVVLISLALVMFCSVSVLCVLIRPGPGDRKKTDQSKRSAFLTIMAIMLVLCLRMTHLIVYDASVYFQFSDNCVLLITGYLVEVPTALVLPLLFLLRMGKLPKLPKLPCKMRKSSQ